MEDMGQGAKTPKHHLVIAGTGRAGTSFLVRYLTECGLETEISRNGDAANWNEIANAGFETFPFEGDLPYVIKQPWLYEFAERFFSRDDVRIDAAVIPIRDLIEASSSRVIREMQAMHEREPGITCSGSTWKTWAHTPGGLVYSLDPLDEARVLAVGFHDLIQVLVERRVPIVFLSFPRFIEDGSYLCHQLRSVLPASLTLDAALAAHAKTADLSKVRVRKGIGRNADAEHLALDNAALKREVQRLNGELHRLNSELQQLNNELQRRNSELHQTMDEVRDLQRSSGVLRKLRRALGRSSHA